MKIPALVAALVAAWAVLSTTAAPALAQDAKAPPPSKDQLAKGDKDAPALIAASGVACAPTAAAFRGTGKMANATVDIYEVACQQGLGYMLLKGSGGAAPQAIDCLAAVRGGTKCVLPGNADPKAGLAPLVAAAGRTCAVSAAEFLGSSTAAHESFYEVACGSAAGFRLGVPKAGGKPDATDCVALLGTDSACKLTSKETAMASLTPLIQASGRPCPVSGVRYVGASSQTNSSYYEVACGAAGGFVLVADTATMKYKQTVDCAKADDIGGGCKLTDPKVSQAAQLGTYTDLATKAGFPCQVSQFRFIGQDSRNREIVELACANRPDGGVAAFGPTGATSNVYDCVRAAGLGQACQLSNPTAVYARYTAALVAKGRGTCKVSNAVWMGSGGASDFIETACADGAPGWVMTLKPGTTMIGELLSCRQASASGLACKLPTNLAGNKGG